MLFLPPAQIGLAVELGSPPGAQAAPGRTLSHLAQGAGVDSKPCGASSASGPSSRNSACLPPAEHRCPWRLSARALPEPLMALRSARQRHHSHVANAALLRAGPARSQRKRPVSDILTFPGTEQHTGHSPHFVSRAQAAVSSTL